MTKTDIIIDLDGTLSDHRWRKHFIEGQEKDWDAYFAGIKEDKPNPEVLMLVKKFQEEGCRIIVFTGRPIQHIGDIVDWLKVYDIKYFNIKVRPEKNFESNATLKIEWLKQYNIEEILLVVDDNKDFCDYCNKIGITTMTYYKP